MAFTTSRDGDLRHDLARRRSVASELQISPHWAVVDQVHGNRVARATEPGTLGSADAIWTTVPNLPMAVFTADCFGVVLIADQAAGVAHSGWRGTVAGVVPALRQAMDEYSPHSAWVGPGIGPCCFEVGPEVVAALPESRSTTSWGTASIDLRAELDRQLSGLSVIPAGACTRCGEGYFSHRRDATSARMATVAWLTQE